MTAHENLLSPSSFRHLLRTTATAGVAWSHCQQWSEQAAKGRAQSVEVSVILDLLTLMWLLFDRNLFEYCIRKFVGGTSECDI